jgi:integrase
VASVNDRWWTLQSDGSKKHSERFGTGMRWQVRYRNVQGQSRNKSFERKSDAEDFMASISVDLNRGLYIDPKTGKRNFDIYSDQWLSQSMVDVSTKVQRELHVRLHMKPFWLKREIGTIRPSDVQEWIIWLSNKGMSPKSVKLIHSNFRIIMQRAVDDEIIPRNPAIGSKISLPKSPQRSLKVWTVDQVRCLLGALPLSVRVMALIVATCGLRQGEVLGLREQDVDFERLVLSVRQQIKIIATRPTPAYPKGQKTREVPMPQFVAQELRSLMEIQPPLEGERLSTPGVGGLIFYLREKKPINKNYFNSAYWHPAIKAAGITRESGTGMHQLRHFCASMWLNSNVNIKAVSEYLGHSDPGFTLRVYTDVMPRTDDLARASFDSISA